MTDNTDPLVLFMPSGRRGRFPVGTPVLDAARSLGVYIESVCGGRGICGRCQIEQQTGEFAKHGITSKSENLSGVNEVEERYARLRTLPPDRRLSCQATVQGDLVIDVPQDVQVNRQVVRKRAESREIIRKPATHLCFVEVEQPDMEKPLGDLDHLFQALERDWGYMNLRADFHLLAETQEVLRKGDWQVTCAIHDDGRGPEVVAIWPGLHNEAYGLAVDIGSTTIAAHLVSLLSGRVVASSGTTNPQIRFGEDLMSRVSYVMMNPDGREAMTKAVREAINTLTARLASGGGIDRSDILQGVLVGNPVLGPPRCTLMMIIGSSSITPRPIASPLSAMPGPLEVVMAMAPPKAAPMVEQIAAISSSAWKVRTPKFLCRLSSWRMSLAGVIGYEPRNSSLLLSFAAVIKPHASAWLPLTLRYVPGGSWALSTW